MEHISARFTNKYPMKILKEHEKNEANNHSP